MPFRYSQHSFGTGEVSAEFDARKDVSRYFSSAARVENYRVKPTGAAVRRDGTQFLAEAKFSDKHFRLELFEFNVEQAYFLEMGEQYIRFYRGLNRIEEPIGTPVEVSTPYLEDELDDIQVIQSADVAFFTHPNHPPQALSRNSDIDWLFAPRLLLPPPSVLNGTFLNATLTLSGTSGTITGTLTDVVGDDLFLDGDVDRSIIAEGRGGIISALVGNAPTTQVTITAIAPFLTTGPFVFQDWEMGLSPVVTLVFDKSGPRGAIATIQAEVLTTTADEEISNGDFQLGNLDWADLSAPLVTSGTHDGATSATVLSDSTATFVASGVEVGHRVLNIPDVEEGRADSVTTTTVTMNPGLPTQTFNNGEAYEIHQTGSVAFTTGSMRLSAEENGIGHSEQQVTGLIDGDRYRLTFSIAETSTVLRIGTTSGGVDIIAKSTFSVGTTNTITFLMIGSTAFVGFSNEQATTTSEVDNVSLKLVSAKVFRQQDVGKFIVGGGGAIQVLTVIDNENATGLIFAPLDEIAESSVVLTGSLDTFLLIAGAWTLEEQAFSTTRGFPRGESFHEGRFLYGGTKANPLTFWGSVSQEFADFSRGTKDSDGFQRTITANQMNTIEWLEPFQDLLIGTRGGEHLITGGDAGLTPSAAAQQPQGTAGSPPLRPIRTDTALIHLQRGRRIIREIPITPDGAQVSQARDLTVINEGITRSGIRQMVLQQQPNRTLWAVRRDGVLIGLTLELFENVRGWHRHTTDGSFCTIVRVPVDDSLTEETERLVAGVHRTIQGVTKSYVEALIPRIEDSTQQRAELTLDSALRHDGAPTTTFSGLEHLEGKTVALVQRNDAPVVLPTGESVTADRLAVLPSQVVVNGQVTTAQPVSRLDVGLNFVSTLTTLRPELALQDGPIQGRFLRWVTLQARIIGTIGMRAAGHIIPFRRPPELMDQGLLPQLATVEAEGEDWNQEGQITFEQTQPLPSTIASMSGSFEFEEAE